MQPGGRVDMVASQSAVNWWRAVEYDLGTGVVGTCTAGRAGRLRAGDAAFEGYAVAYVLMVKEQLILPKVASFSRRD